MPDFTLVVSDQDVIVIGSGLHESPHPYKVVAALIAKIQAQINEQVAAAAAKKVKG